ncbi:uncharacterized protein ColSpa_04731 [Colletotrichum spaethianum]|uniref:Uncharacterized protein n=1 Tax=Colletotrichum spaethianum TaxID=700344 RepID=A0AA37LDF4_9PEZI|nr:uncharacterized protein ColSpa_04731 [Colletotrichum spaethianum]GKT44550.1 hypothetical protein ColSpa_04731 [Colletotrichum spaethianum]
MEIGDDGTYSEDHATGEKKVLALAGSDAIALDLTPTWSQARPWYADQPSIKSPCFGHAN